MLKKWNNFNENWFSRKESEDVDLNNLHQVDNEANKIVQPGFRTTVPRKEEEVNRLSDEDRQNQIDDFRKSKEISDSRVDPYFIQEISDRLYGPDSASYIEAIKEVNRLHRPRKGKHGSQFYDNEFSDAVRNREKEINSSIEKRG